MAPPREDSIQARSEGSSSGDGSTAGMLQIRINEAQNVTIPIQLSTLDANHKEAQPYCVVEVDKNEVVANAKEWNLRGKQLTWNHKVHLCVF